MKIKAMIVLAVIYLSGSLQVFAQTNIYSEKDKDTLRDFLRLGGNLENLWQNGTIDTAYWEKNEVWLLNNNIKGLIWNDSTPKKLMEIIWRDVNVNLRISGLDRLESITIYESTLSAFEVSECDQLSDIYLHKINGEFNIDITRIPNLRALSCYTTTINNLTIKGHQKIARLNLDSNKSITTLDLEGCYNLTDVYVTESKLKELNLSDLKRLTRFSCFNNQITSINWGEIDSLKTININTNQLASLDLSNFTELTRLDCGYNQITSLDLQHVKELEYLSCQHNKLTSLDLRENEELQELDCNNNRLKTIRFEKQYFKTFICHENLLLSLEMKDLSAKYFSCFNNYLSFSDFPVTSNSGDLFVYAPQKQIVFAIQEDGNVDLSRYLYENQTSFSWYLKDDPSTATADVEETIPGIFQIPEKYIGRRLICKVYNPSYPDFKENYHFSSGYVGDFYGDATLISEVSTTVSNEQIQSGNIYASGSNLYIKTEKASELTIYNIAGQLQVRKKITEGTTEIPLPKGLYILSLNNYRQKVVIR